MQKINQKNTWELNLIDHLCEIIKVEEEDDTETNFQKVYLTPFFIYSFHVSSKMIIFSANESSSGKLMC